MNRTHQPAVTAAIAVFVGPALANRVYRLPSAGPQNLLLEISSRASPDPGGFDYYPCRPHIVFGSTVS